MNTIPKPRIVVLDGYTLNPGDLSWEPLESLGDCAIYDRSAEDQIVPRAGDAPIVLTNKTPLTADTIARLQNLKYIGVLATGYDVVDVTAAKRRGTVVTNVPTYGTRSVAQMVFAHLLNLTQHVAEHAVEVSAGRWSGAEDWCFWDFPLVELEGLTMGIVGYGRIGRETARLAHAFGMRVLACSGHAIEPGEDVQPVDLETIFRDSDVVSLHCPLTPDTKEIVNRDRLALMKPTALLINTSRGPLIDEAALAEALNAGRLAGAGLDVLQTEPPPVDHPLLSAKNCYITPHIAWATRSSRGRLLQTAIENVSAFLVGKAQNMVSDEEITAERRS